MIHLKSRREIEKMRRSADLVGRTLAEVAKLIQPGVTTLELDKVAEAFVRARGAIPAFKGYKIPNAPPFPGTLCTSVNDVIVHGIPNGIPFSPPPRAYNVLSDKRSLQIGKETTWRIAYLVGTARPVLPMGSLPTNYNRALASVYAKNGINAHAVETSSSS